MEKKKPQDKKKPQPLKLKTNVKAGPELQIEQ
jgi:hypothetical protein